MAVKIKLKAPTEGQAPTDPDNLIYAEPAFDGANKLLYIGYTGGTTSAKFMAEGLDGSYATSAQGTLAASAVQPGDNLSTLTNDSGFLSDYSGLATALGTLAGTTTIGAASSTIQIAHDLTVVGDLTIQGATTTLNTAELVVEDHQIVLGNTASPDDGSALSGGIRLKGATDKTFLWENASGGAWVTTESMNLFTGKDYRIAGVSVLSGTTLGTNVVNSSLTSVGTLTSGQWKGQEVQPTYGGTGQTSYTAGDILFASGTTTLAKRSIGSANQVLTVDGAGEPTWADIPAATSTPSSTLTGIVDGGTWS